MQEMQEIYHRERQEILRRRQMEATQYMMAPPAVRISETGSITWVDPAPRRTYTLEELEFRVREAAARASQEAHANIADRIANAADDAFERGRCYVKPTPKQPLPIHRALSRMLHADERYENRVFLPGGHLVRDE